ncbi:hypothetical protein [Pseudoalteromonas rubra]|uniref:hypothetical protein n=1 Tax=Pseudoalteromonas rubra TaxID=43658 RepID=UPI0011097265|nr:hypothetical protein [Pseudoalteromonas rubra]
MVVNQKYRGRKSRFEFGEHSLRHMFSDNDQTVEFTTLYSGIDIDPIVLTEKNVIWKFVTIPFWFLAISTMGKVVISAESQMQALGGMIMVGFWLACVGMCYLFNKRGQVTLTMFDSAKGRIVVINDGKHEPIVNELENRIRSLYYDEDETVH